MACTLPSPLHPPFPFTPSPSPEEDPATGRYPRDRQHLFKNPVSTVGREAGMGWVGDSSVRLHSRISGGGSAQQGRQEVKIAPACQPSVPCPRLVPGLGSRSYSGAWENYIPRRKAPSQPSPTLPFSLPEAAGYCGSLSSRQRKEGRAETEGGRRWRRVRRAGPPMMPKVPDPETASGRSSASALVTEPVAQPESIRLALCSVASSIDTQAITHLISESPAATSASSGGPTHKKACLLWTI